MMLGSCNLLCVAQGLLVTNDNIAKLLLQNIHCRHIYSSSSNAVQAESLHDTHFGGCKKSESGNGSKACNMTLTQRRLQYQLCCYAVM